MEYKTVVKHETTHEGAGRFNFLARVFVLRVAFALCRPQERGRQCANCGSDKNRDKKLSGGVFFFLVVTFLYGKCMIRRPFTIAPNLVIGVTLSPLSV